jgi:lipoyl(octanoyl) transferase
MENVDWSVSRRPVGYLEAVAAMEARVAAIRDGLAPGHVWLLEHPPLYTAGTSARPEDLLEHGRFPVFASGRGGQYTYHGPGQRVAYVMLDLRPRGADLGAYVRALEDWITKALHRAGVTAFRRAGRVGLWVPTASGGEDKIAAIGVRVRRWITFHGVSVNIAPDLAHYGGIVPCGIREHGVTSLRALGRPTTMTEFDLILREAFALTFGVTTSDAAPPLLGTDQTVGA